MSEIKDQYIYSTKNGEWSFYDKNNRPIGIYYPNIEKAIDALYNHVELSKINERSKNCSFN